MNTPERLNCPNCGAAEMSDRTQCEFCKSLPKTVGCTSCLRMMFIGSKFCIHCGLSARPAAMIDDGYPGECPRCGIELRSLLIDTVHIRECGKCGGLWSGIESFENLCTSKELQATVLRFIGSHSRPDTVLQPVKYLPCPVCSNLMNRSNFARSSGVIIDLCKQHGVWFDVGELPGIIEFIEKGGIDRAREKEKIAIADERAKLRDEERKLAMIARRSGGSRFSVDEADSGFGAIIARLFDL